MAKLKGVSSKTHTKQKSSYFFANTLIIIQNVMKKTQYLVFWKKLYKQSFPCPNRRA